MQDMKQSAQETQAAQPQAAEGPKEAYPYGLRINLGAKELEKLGLKGLPKVGDKFQIEALATVESVHESASKDGPGGYKSCELQITHLELDEDDGGEQENVGEKLYGGQGGESGGQAA